MAENRSKEVMQVVCRRWPQERRESVREEEEGSVNGERQMTQSEGRWS